MQDVDAEAPHEIRQRGLMPENIPDRRPMALRNGHDAHRSSDEAEERKVLLKDEEREFVERRGRKKGAQQREYILADPGAAALYDGGRQGDPHAWPFRFFPAHAGRWRQRCARIAGRKWTRSSA